MAPMTPDSPIPAVVPGSPDGLALLYQGESIRSEFAFVTLNAHGHDSERFVAHAFSDLIDKIEMVIDRGHFHSLVVTELQKTQDLVRRALIERAEHRSEEAAASLPAMI